MKEKYAITGMSCSACSTRVQKNVSAIDGVQKADVNLLTNSMQVEYDTSQVSEQTIIDAVTQAGYGAILMTPNSAKTDPPPGSTHETFQDLLKKEAQLVRIRLIGSILFWIPLLYVSMYFMMYQSYGWPVPNWSLRLLIGPQNAVSHALLQFILLIPIISLNWKYFRNGFLSLYRKNPNMDSLVATGSTAAILYGIYALFQLSYGVGHQNWAFVEQYHMEIYFESAGTILTLITLGKYLESRSKAQTGKVIEKLVKLTPQTAFLERNGVEQEVPSDEIVPGDIVILKPGSYVPVDGVIISGNSLLDESAITGESIPVEKTIGDTVISASFAKNGSFKMRATKTGNQTTISQIIQLVEEASSSKAPIARLADKIAGIFVPAVMSIALLAFLIWIFVGASFDFSLSIGIAILVISCPCALGLATPVAIMVGTGKGAENGILIKSGDALETAHNIDTVVLDKTGTITEGKPFVTDIYVLQDTSEKLLEIAATLEKNSEHPLAEAIMTYAKDYLDIAHLPEVEHFEAIFGRGIRAVLQNAVYLAGNEAFMSENLIDTSAITDTLNQLSEEGKSVLLFARNQTLLGLIAAADKEKDSSKEAIEAFQKLGIDVVMLTGDHKKTATAIGKKLHITHVIAEVLPAQKEAEIRKLQEQGHIVGMVGDGINDAPALVRADVGIAIGAGTDIAIESADAVLVRNSLLDAVNAIRLSRAVLRNIKQNLFWAFFYNVVSIPLAAGIWYPFFGVKLSPMIGAAAMSLSSICVVGNALRLNFFKPLHSISLDETPTSQQIIAETAKQQSVFPIKLEKGEKNMNLITLSIEGMMCAHCQKHVSDALNALDGVQATVDLENNQAVLSISQDITDEILMKTVSDAGYQVTNIVRS